MSKEQFDLKQTDIEAIPDNMVWTPAIPVSVALQEAEDLYEWCQPDKALLIKVGLDPMLIEDLPARTGACRYAQSIWQKEYKSMEESQKEWQLKSPAAYELKKDILHHYFHAYRNYPDLLTKVQKIAEGDGHADMIQDLSDMSVLGNSNPVPLENINFDMTLLEKATETSSAMADLLAKANGARMSDNKMKLTRDKAYTYLKQAVDEIRHHGQYVFWHNEERKKGYVSRYMQTHFNRTKKQTKKTEVSPE